MPDTNRLPRIGEIWADKNDNKIRVLILHCNESVQYFHSMMFVGDRSLKSFLEYFEPTNTEYDLDPLVLALKGDHT